MGPLRRAFFIASGPWLAAWNGPRVPLLPCPRCGARLLTKTETITAILFYLTAMQFILGLGFAGFDGDITLPNVQNVPWLLLIAICGLVAHFCLTTALSIAPAATVMPIDFVRLPVIAFIGMLFYSEALDPWVFAGAIVIFGANYFNIWHASRQST